MAKKFDRTQFFRTTSGFDRDDLERMLWTLYWRGDARMRVRVEDLIDPAQVTVTEPAPPSPKEVRRDVKEFAALARAGAYLARDRRVSPKERTRWRFTYKDHFTQSFAALSAGSGEEIRPAVEAVSTLITLACETEGFDYFRSEDPIEASKVVISEKVDQLWTGIGQAGLWVRKSCADSRLFRSSIGNADSGGLVSDSVERQKRNRRSPRCCLVTC